MFEKLLTTQSRTVAPLALLALLLVSVTASTAPQVSGDSDQCIRCHVEPYNSGIKQTYQHPPFFERQCTACHLATGSDWSGAATSGSTASITGTLVSQELIWGKINRFTDEGQSFDHLVALRGLEGPTNYRFRIVNGTQPGQAVLTSPWLGLRPAELSASSPVRVAEGVADSSVTDLTVAPAGGTGAIVSWQTAEPLYGWVEIQLLEGGLTTAETEVAAEDGHPPLRDPEDLAIEACYECHPRSTLGASHPVRLYSGRDVQIPDDLPTVDGMLTCVTCHDPHAAPGKMLVREVIKTKLCVTCHTKFKNSSPSTMFD